MAFTLLQIACNMYRAQRLIISILHSYMHLGNGTQLSACATVGYLNMLPCVSFSSIGEWGVARSGPDVPLEPRLFVHYAQTSGPRSQRHGHVPPPPPPETILRYLCTMRLSILFPNQSKVRGKWHLVTSLGSSRSATASSLQYPTVH